MATIAGEPPYEERSVFVRKATGLVRGWSVHDAFIYAAFSINLITLGLYIFSFGPFIPKASLLLAVILSGAYLVFQTVVYAALIAVMPRAGGVYVFLREAYGTPIGFLYGWTLFLVIQTGTIAAVAIAGSARYPQLTTVPAITGATQSGNRPPAATVHQSANDFLLPIEGTSLRSALSVHATVQGPELVGPGLAVSAIKESEDGEWLVLRCVNLRDEPATGMWRVPFDPNAARVAQALPSRPLFPRTRRDQTAPSIADCGF